ncbi:MAG: S26 family signal peptidase [Candidatus Levybacteria bacterium]|nr:S26 family signal peptidase [Candidatus Levybacteria bacterium]
MEPAIRDGQNVFVSGISYLFSKPKAGDIVAFRKNEKVFVKRIAKINNDNYFVRGDNREDSLDSRKIGWINRKEILGKVIFKISNY